MIEQWCEPGTGAPPHTHFEVEELIAVLEGEAELTVDGAITRVVAGESILLPASSRHSFTNVGAGILQTLAVFPSPDPPVEYEEEPGVVYAIGGEGERRRDAHRAFRGP